MLQELIDKLHSKKMNILLDHVSNHVHKDHPVIKAHPEWATILNLPDGRLNLQLYDEYRLTTWFDTFLPTLDFSNPEAIDIMTDSALYWIENYGIDGFRHDATKHIQLDFWRSLSNKIYKYTQKILIGDIFIRLEKPMAAMN